MPFSPASPRTDAGAGSGAPGRVAQVHAQTRRGLLLAAGFVAAAVVAGTTRGIGDWWLALHLFVVGALLSAISATTQLLAVTWSAAPAPVPLVAAAQRWSVAAGAVALVAGRETGRTWLFVGGGATVVVAMLGLAAILLSVRRRAVTARFAPAIEAYVAAAVAGAAGMSIGLLLGTGRAGGRIVELRGAHVVLNVFGLVGLVVAGTLPYFVATQVRAKMSRRATPTAMRAAFAALALATAIAVTGHLVDRPAVVAAGFSAYAVGLLAVAAMLPIFSRRRLTWAGPRLVQLVAGVVWWVGSTVALAVNAIRGSSDRTLLQTLVIGGLAQILVASLAYLGPVLRGGGHRHLTAGFVVTRSWISVAAGNAAALAALAGQGQVLAGALALWLVDLSIRAARLAATRRAVVA